MDLRILPLDNAHDRKSFRCGEPSLDEYLHRYAGRDIRRRINRVFVAVPADEPHQIAAFYSLSAGSLDAKAMPDADRRRLPRYPLAVALVGRLAVATSQQGQGIGAIVLADALSRVAAASVAMAVYAVVVDALDERVADFYRKFGFIALPSRRNTLFLLLDSFGGLSGT